MILSILSKFQFELHKEISCQHLFYFPKELHNFHFSINENNIISYDSIKEFINKINNYISCCIEYYPYIDFDNIATWFSDEIWFNMVYVCKQLYIDKNITEVSKILDDIFIYMEAIGYEDTPVKRLRYNLECLYDTLEDVGWSSGVYIDGVYEIEEFHEHWLFDYLYNLRNKFIDVLHTRSFVKLLP